MYNQDSGTKGVPCRTLFRAPFSLKKHNPQHQTSEGRNLNAILTDTSRPALTTAFEKNILSFFRLFDQWPQAEVHDTPELTWSITDIPFPLFNSVIRTRLMVDTIDDTIDSILAGYKARHVPMMWWAGPGTQPPDLGKNLVDRGLRESASPGMTVNLALLPESYALPKGLVVRRVENQQELETWGSVVFDVFGMPDFAADAFLDFFLCLGFDSPLTNYIGSLDNVAVAASSVYHGGGVAGIYNVATIEHARRKGIGAAMTALPLLESRSDGYRIGVLESSKYGFNVYRRLGFQETSKVFHYIWMGDQ